jgi:hypothetical protein
MTIPVIHNWMAGDEFNAERMNEVAAAIEFLRNPPMVRVNRNSAQTGFSSTGTWNKISFNNLYNNYDPWNMWDSGTPDTITFTEPGWYSCEIVMAYQPTSTDGRMGMGLFKNGFTTPDMLMQYNQNTLPSGNNVIARKESTYFFNAGDFVYCGAYVNGFTGATSANSEPQSWGFRTRWVSN